MRGDARRYEAMRGDTRRCDAMWCGASRDDAMRGDVCYFWGYYKQFFSRIIFLRLTIENSALPYLSKSYWIITRKWKTWILKQKKRIPNKLLIDRLLFSHYLNYTYIYITGASPRWCCEEMRCDAIRCDARRCDAMGGDMMRGDVLRCEAMWCQFMWHYANLWEFMWIYPKPCEIMLIYANLCESMRIDANLS